MLKQIVDDVQKQDIILKPKSASRKWSELQHQEFVKAIWKYGKNSGKISEKMGSKTKE